MNLKKLAALVIALAMFIIPAGALAEDNSEDRIAELEARIAELEADVEEKDAYIAELETDIEEKDAYIAELEHDLAVTGYIAEFDGGYVTVEEAMAEYSYVEYMYSMYGYSMDGYEDFVKSDIATTLVQDKIISLKAAELGLDVPTEEQDAELRASAEATMDMYIDTYRGDFIAEGLSEEEIDQATIDFLAENGVTVDYLYEQELAYFATDNLYAYIVAGVEVSDDDVKALYDSYVAEDEAYYADSLYYYESAMMSGTPVYWHPEGYRNVKQVLVMFNDDQSARYDEITDAIYDLELEMAAATSSGETGSEDVATTEATRTPEEIQADLDARYAELDALYAELEPLATEVVTHYNEGVPFDDLAFLYSGDTGSLNNATGEVLTYAVCADSEAYDGAFVEAAMSIPEIGGISEPTPGMYGLYIVYYDSDVTPGAVDYESVKDDLYFAAYDAACAEAYDAQISAWCEELNVVYYMENFH